MVIQSIYMPLNWRGRLYNASYSVTTSADSAFSSCTATCDFWTSDTYW